MWWKKLISSPGTDCIGSRKFNYHTITMTPESKWKLQKLKSCYTCSVSKIIHEFDFVLLYCNDWFWPKPSINQDSFLNKAAINEGFFSFRNCYFHRNFFLFQVSWERLLFQINYNIILVVLLYHFLSTRVNHNCFQKHFTVG